MSSLFKITILKIVFIALSFLLNTSTVFSQYAIGVGMDTRDSLWLSWNVLLKEGTTARQRQSAIQKVVNYIKTDYNRKFAAPHTLRVTVFYCPCDSFLYNIGAKVLNGSGQSVTSPSAPPPPQGGSGGSILLVSNNNNIQEKEKTGEVKKNRFTLLDSGKLSIDTKILAIIDTGLDTSFFSSPIKKMIWKASRGRTIYNVVDSRITKLFDDHAEKHGTIVAAIALQALQDQNSVLGNNKFNVPSLMVIKALDKNKDGTTFTVSCALSYANQNNAAIINLSLGYYEKNGKVDSVFEHYIKLNSANGTVFAAAGNLHITHDPTKICDNGTANLLTKANLFYPACFSTTLKNVLAITTLTNPHSSCFYQNYSPDFVSLGVLQTNRQLCCHFSTPFSKSEGSSFATPVASGTAMSYILNNRRIDDFLRAASIENMQPFATKNGKYIKYFSR